MFENPADYDAITEMSDLTIENCLKGVEDGKLTLKTGDKEIPVRIELTDKELAVLKVGGKINFIKNMQ